MEKKNNKQIILIALGVALVIAIIWGVSARNKFVTLEEEVSKQWSLVENQYQRRLDLIPNLVETVKGYATHESETLTDLAEARSGLSSAYQNAEQLRNAPEPTAEEDMQRYSRAQQELGSALSIYVNAVHEAYPELKANENFKDLQTQLEGTENRIATERGRYSETVQAYNIAVRKFPGSVIASMAGFNTKPQFSADQGASTAPKVQF